MHPRSDAWRGYPARSHVAGRVFADRTCDMVGSLPVGVLLRADARSMRCLSGPFDDWHAQVLKQAPDAVLDLVADAARLLHAEAVGSGSSQSR
jgi:hypothetical protein